MKADILSLEGKKLKSIDLPKQFSEEYRPDLIKKSVLSIRSKLRQSYGASPEAGKGYSAKVSKRRKNYKGCYGHGISRTPRKVMWRRGTQFGWVGAYAPNTVGGRKAHPPKSNKVWEKEINIKENRKAIRSAISSTILKEVVNRNYNLPFILENKFENLNKTKEIKTVLKNLNLENEIERIETRKIRSGKGKLRGRKYKSKKGILFVVSKKCNLIKAGNNFNGFDIIEINNLNTNSIAPGIKTTRLTVYTEGAIERLAKENLFFDIKTKKVTKK